MSKNPTRHLTDCQTQFEKVLRDIAGNRYHIREVFDDFLFMVSTSFRQAAYAVNHDGKLSQEIEDLFKPMAKRYPVANDLYKALPFLIQGLELRAHDFLGEMFMALDGGNDRTGQFFTPQCVSDLMARMVNTQESYEAHLAAGKRMKFMEPASGSGGTLIAMVPLLREWNAHPATVYFDATDIDIRCVRMCYIHLTLLGIPAMVRHGNTLSMEMWDAWPTMSLALNPLPPEKPGCEPPPESKSTSPPAKAPDTLRTLQLAKRG